jgi:hypothetical protein
MKRKLIYFAVCLLAKMSCRTRWIPGVACRLASWSIQFDRATGYQTGLWRRVSNTIVKE